MKFLIRNSYCFELCKLMSFKWNEVESLICFRGGDGYGKYMVFFCFI